MGNFGPNRPVLTKESPESLPGGMKDAFSCSERICQETTDFPPLENIWLTFLCPLALVLLFLLPDPHTFSGFVGRSAVPPCPHHPPPAHQHTDHFPN